MDKMQDENRVAQPGHGTIPQMSVGTAFGWPSGRLSESSAEPRCTTRASLREKWGFSAERVEVPAAPQMAPVKTTPLRTLA